MHRIFQEHRIIGLAGEKSSGKTNNLMALIKNFREYNQDTKIYVYGLDDHTLEWLEQFENVYEVSSLEQLSNKRDGLFIIDEFQRLKLNDRRHKEILDEFIDFIYHKNNWVIFSSPNLREFNSIIGGKIEQWCLKSLSTKNLVNGSQLKEVAINYKGRPKSMDRIMLEKNELLIINDQHEKIIKLDYISEIDKKKDYKNIFVNKLSEKRSETKEKI